METKEELNELLNNVAVHCKTEKEANEVLNLAYNLGYAWITNDSFKDKNYFNQYKENTCYNIQLGIFFNIDNNIIEPKSMIISAKTFINLVNNKYPFYKTNQKEWDTIIKPKLEEFGYSMRDINNFDYMSNVVYKSEFDIITNLSSRDSYLSKLIEINDLDEYLTFMGLMKGIKYVKQNTNTKQDNKMETKEFTKADLKSGMVVVTRNMGDFIVVNDLLINNSGFIYLNSYNDSFEINNRKCDIIEIYDKSSAWGKGFNYDYPKNRLLWKRVEKVKMSIQEIEEKLGLVKGTLIIK